MSASAMESAVATALRSVISRVHLAAERSGWPPEKVRVVAVSKTKPVSVIQQVYDAGHRVFGENYVQELVEKSPQLPADIEWHFIGNLQSNKVKALLGAVPNLVVVESVDDKKIANHLDRAVANLGRKPLKVLVQVNTSGEESKYGVEPSECVELAKHVKLGCSNLIFSGLMTIGMLDYSSTPENFKALCKCRTEVCEALGIPEEQCELSMGMSADFEQAVPLLESEMASSYAISKLNNDGLRFKNKNCHCGSRCAGKISESTKNNDMLYYRCATKKCSFFEWCYPHTSDSHTRQEEPVMEDSSDANYMQPRSEDIILMQMHDEIKRNAQDIMKLNITINYVEKICASCLVCCVICLLVTIIGSIYK